MGWVINTNSYPFVSFFFWGNADRYNLRLLNEVFKLFKAVYQPFTLAVILETIPLVFESDRVCLFLVQCLSLICI